MWNTYANIMAADALSPGREHSKYGWLLALNMLVARPYAPIHYASGRHTVKSREVSNLNKCD